MKFPGCMRRAFQTKILIRSNFWYFAIQLKQMNHIKYVKNMFLHINSNTEKLLIICKKKFPVNDQAYYCFLFKWIAWIFKIYTNFFNFWKLKICFEIFIFISFSFFSNKTSTVFRYEVNKSLTAVLQPGYKFLFHREVYEILTEFYLLLGVHVR